MTKYNVLISFRDFVKGVDVKKGQVIELSKERADELTKNLEKFGGGFIERVPAPKKKVNKKEGE